MYQICKKAKLFATIFFTFVISFILINNNLAFLKSNEVTDWKVVITNDTKDFKDTEEVHFKVDRNENVVDGKIAPGLKAKSEIEIDLTGTKYSVDIKAKIDDSNIKFPFVLTTKLNGEEYIPGNEITINLENSKVFTEKNGKIKLELELEWDESSDDKMDTFIGENLESIEIPIEIEVKQHI